MKLLRYLFLFFVFINASQITAMQSKSKHKNAQDQKEAEYRRQRAEELKKLSGRYASIYAAARKSDFLLAHNIESTNKKESPLTPEPDKKKPYSKTKDLRKIVRDLLSKSMKDDDNGKKRGAFQLFVFGYKFGSAKTTQKAGSGRRVNSTKDWLSKNMKTRDITQYQSVSVSIPEEPMRLIGMLAETSGVLFTESLLFIRDIIPVIRSCWHFVAAGVGLGWLVSKSIKEKSAQENTPYQRPKKPISQATTINNQQLYRFEGKYADRIYSREEIDSMRRQGITDNILTTNAYGDPAFDVLEDDDDQPEEEIREKINASVSPGAPDPEDPWGFHKQQEKNTTIEGIVLKGIVLKGEINFSETTIKHMDNPNRHVPVQILKEVIQKPIAIKPDPQESSALMYYSQIWKNGKYYNIEVLYDIATNQVRHFLYSEEKMGPLPAIKKSPKSGK